MTGTTLRHAAWILRGNPLTAIAAAGVVLLVVIAVFGPQIVPYDPIASNVSQALMPPSAAHLAGTDQLGRDTFSRLIVATRLDLVIAVSAVGISFVLGAVIGAFCGYSGGRLDRTVGRFVDVMMAFPLFARGGQHPPQSRLGGGGARQRRKPYLGGAAFPAAECTSGHGGTDVTQSRLGHSERRRTLLYRPRRQASDPGVGHHGRGGRTLHFDRQMVAGRISGTRVDAGRAVLQLARRWDAGHSRSAHADMTQPLLRIEDLHVTFSTRRGLVEAVRGVTLSLDEGEMLGLVGESGSGKSVTGFATTRLLDAAGRVTAGRILFRGQDITKIPDGDFRMLHGAAISMIFQNPRAALNPIRAIGQQIADAILSHKRMSREQAAGEALELLRAVQIRDPEKRMAAYPHELSGGMCQRVMIAIAISCAPMLLIADEPTTGLDVTTQKVVMDLLAGIAAERGMATILITHDLGLAARYCRRVVVMERGL